MQTVPSYFLSKHVFQAMKSKLDGYVYWKELPDYSVEIKIVAPCKGLRTHLENISLQKAS
jgi:hypothetical protein